MSLVHGAAKLNLSVMLGIKRSVRVAKDAMPALMDTSYGKSTLNPSKTLESPYRAFMPNPKEHVISGSRLTCLISNARRLLNNRYRKFPLWAMVSDLTGNGSTISIEICRSAGYDPHQKCGVKYLKTLTSL